MGLPVPTQPIPSPTPSPILPWGEDVEKDRPKNYYTDCVNRPRPCPWIGCKWHLMLDVNPETGSMTFNVGQVKDPVHSDKRGRSRTLKRRVGIVQAKGKKNGTYGHGRFLHAEAELFDTLHDALKAEDKPDRTCLLDAVEGGETYTLEEAGRIFNVTRERVRQIEVIGLKKLRDGRESWKDLMEWEDHRSDEQ